MVTFVFHPAHRAANKLRGENGRVLKAVDNMEIGEKK